MKYITPTSPSNQVSVLDFKVNSTVVKSKIVMSLTFWMVSDLKRWTSIVGTKMKVSGFEVLNWIDINFFWKAHLKRFILSYNLSTFKKD